MSDVYSKIVNSNKLVNRSSIAIAFLLLAILLLLIVPANSSPSNSAGQCKALIEDPMGNNQGMALEEITILEWLLGVQRQEAVCKDMSTVRWLYVGLVLAGLLLILASIRYPNKILKALISLVLTALTTALILDGPILPLFAAVLSIVGYLFIKKKS